MAPNSRGIAMVEQDRQRALERAAYHRARLAPLDKEERFDYVAAVFAKNAHVAGLLASPSTRDSIIGDPLIMVLKGGGELLAAGRPPAIAMEIIPCDGVQQALNFARLFGAPCPDGSFPICLRLPH